MLCIYPRTLRFKSYSEEFFLLKNGSKPFVVCKNSRDYTVGDALHIEEWELLSHDNSLPTGHFARKVISYVFSGTGLKEGYVVLGLV